MSDNDRTVPTYAELVECICVMVLQHCSREAEQRDALWRVKRKGLRIEAFESASENAEWILTWLGIIDEKGWFLVEVTDAEAIKAKVLETLRAKRDQPLAETMLSRPSLFGLEAQVANPVDALREVLLREGVQMDEKLIESARKFCDGPAETPNQIFRVKGLPKEGMPPGYYWYQSGPGDEGDFDSPEPQVVHVQKGSVTFVGSDVALPLSDACGGFVPIGQPRFIT